MLHRLRRLVIGRSAAVATLAFVPVLQAAAQTPAQTGAIRGRVLDQTGAPIPHAEVVVQSDSGRTIRVTRVDAAGRYHVRGLAPGRYTIRWRALGYEPATTADYGVAAGPEAVADAKLATAATPLTQQLVTATRSAASAAAVPSAVTVVTREQIESQTKVAPRLGPILAQAVPGLAAATENLSNFGQNIRGRSLLVLIDGIPQSTSRNVSRDFVNIDPAAVERVEVIRGATSLYGDGATGGVVNIITRRPTPGPLRYSTSVSSEASLSRLGSAGLGPRVAQTV